METIGNTGLWLVFAVVVAGMLALDLFVFKSGHQHRVSLKEAAAWSAGWVSVALLFNLGLWWYLTESSGPVIANDKALEFLTGYLVEKSLAVDNVFVWMMIFSYFAIPLELQRRVLLYGIVGAIVLRTIMIFSGSWLITEFHWILYIFGVFLILTGFKMAFFAEHEPDLAKNPFIRWIRNHYPVTETLEGERFFLRRQGVLMVTPLFLALVMVEISDVIFAVDSIPAVFAITNDPFIVLTSNLFAILGLRAMYFLLADIGDRFAMLKYGLAVILVFIGTKMLIVDWYKIPVLVSLSVVGAILLVSVIFSLWHSKRYPPVQL
ncbi:MAG: TerC family protein [Pseudohongiella sp.]|nr:TerC family protein [Pseudohongiella sp.]MDP2126469.1 TerC family protein [Pseudohongiella sp.]